VAWLSLLGAAALTLGAVALLLLPGPAPAPRPAVTVTVAVAATEVAGVATATPPPTLLPAETLPTLPPDAAPALVVAAEATLSPQQRQALLAAPLLQEGSRFTLNYDPFTVIKGDRPRSSFVQYTIVRGDTIDAISRRYNLKSESIAWCNDRRIIFVLRVGDVLTIPPTDGVCHRVLGTREETVAELATTYKVANPLDIIDFPLNNLYGTDPTARLPGGLTVFIPGGEGEPITWNPGYNAEKDENGNVVSVTFAAGQAGSCGNVPAGGGSFWGNPLPGGRWVRGFYAGHTGIDLSAPVGTPVYAAQTGPVLFSGFSRWGYGEAIVLAHGAFSTLYGHMSQRNLGCGQVAVVGQVIGLVGSTGNSTGPHLHFEVRFNDVPMNPSGLGTGW
jgi:murein DD-endopeptidase MepM/ murein hydrolase activator NlpD